MECSGYCWKIWGTQFIDSIHPIWQLLHQELERRYLQGNFKYPIYKKHTYNLLYITILDLWDYPGMTCLGFPKPIVRSPWICWSYAWISLEPWVANLNCYATNIIKYPTSIKWKTLDFQSLGSPKPMFGYPRFQSLTIVLFDSRYPRFWVYNI